MQQSLLTLLMLAALLWRFRQQHDPSHPELIRDCSSMTRRSRTSGSSGPRVAPWFLLPSDGAESWRLRRSHLRVTGIWVSIGPNIFRAVLWPGRRPAKKALRARAIRYFRALLNDLEIVGDGKGGDGAASRDHGYALRALGPYSALAYDWLHDAPGVDAELLALARKRFKAWTDWYAENGYRARSPGTNYNAGYVFAATLIAVAQGGEAGEDGAQLGITSPIRFLRRT